MHGVSDEHTVRLVNEGEKFRLAPSAHIVIKGATVVFVPNTIEATVAGPELVFVEVNIANPHPFH
jgi:hypothetical protein